jgi:hypothetical protein
MAFKLVETGKLTWPSPSLGSVLTVTPGCKVASWDLQHARLILRRRQHIHRIDAPAPAPPPRRRAVCGRVLLTLWRSTPTRGVSALRGGAWLVQVTRTTWTCWHTDMYHPVSWYVHLRLHFAVFTKCIFTHLLVAASVSYLAFLVHVGSDATTRSARGDADLKTRSTGQPWFRSRAQWEHPRDHRGSGVGVDLEMTKVT